MVRRTDVDRAERVLRDLGYRCAADRPLEVSRAIGPEHRLSRTVGGDKLQVELHWDAFHHPFSGIPEELVWSHVEAREEMGGNRFDVFDRSFTLIHTAAHFAWHSLGQPRLLETLGRAWDSWRDSLDVSGLAALAEQTGTRHALDYALWAAGEHGFAHAIPDLGSKRARALRKILPAHKLTEPRAQPDYEMMALALLLAPAPAAIRHAWRILLPPRAQMGLITGRTEPFRVAAGYATRPARAALRWLRVRSSTSPMQHRGPWRSG